MHQPPRFHCTINHDKYHCMLISRECKCMALRCFTHTMLKEKFILFLYMIYKIM